MNLRAAAIVALAMFLAAQVLPGYRTLGDPVPGWQIMAEVFWTGWDFAIHPSNIRIALTVPDSYERTLGILAWSGIAANLAMIAAICLGLLQRTVAAFIAAAAAVSVATMVVVVLTWDGGFKLQTGGWLWTASMTWLFAATGWSLWQERRRDKAYATPG